MQAAFARTTDLDPTVPTIAFMVTDAPPHLQAHPPAVTNQNELNYLAGRAMDNWAKAAAAGRDELSRVLAVLDSEVDAHHYNQVLGQIKHILKQDMPAEALAAA